MLNQKIKTAGITGIMIQLQKVVNNSIFIKKKNTLVFDLQKAIEKKLKQMVKENPLRLEFYEKYKKIIEEYNNGKDINATQKAFDDLIGFLNNLSKEDSRAMREGLDQETLAIFDLLKKETLTDNERDEVKKVSKQTLEKLKIEKLKVERWRESTQLKAQIKTAIFDSLLNFNSPLSFFVNTLFTAQYTENSKCLI